MASNTGRGRRIGAVRGRSQTYNPKTKLFTKRGKNGQYMDTKEAGSPFKGVRKEK